MNHPIKQIKKGLDQHDFIRYTTRIWRSLATIHDWNQMPIMEFLRQPIQALDSGEDMVRDGQKVTNVKYDLGQRLRELRKAKGDAVGSSITQESVAKALGVRYATYNSWENNRSTPRSMDDWCKLADHFNVAIDYLIRGGNASSIYLASPSREDRGISWQLTSSEPSDQQANAVRVFSLFAEGKSDAEIMSAMKVSMPEIRNMLLDATRDGPVEIKAVKRDQDLEEALKQKYKGTDGLLDARVFSIGETNPFFSKILVGWGAKEYLLEELNKPFVSRMTIGIAGGTTLSNMFRFIKRGECPHISISIYPLCISPTEVAIGVDPNTIIGDLAYRQQNYIDAFTLPYVSTEAMSITADTGRTPPEALAARRVLGKAANVDMAFLGVGALDDMMAYMMGEFFRVPGGMTMEEIREKAIGDILYHIVDKKARIVDQHYDDFVCAIELDVLRKMVSDGKHVALVTHSGRKEMSRAVIEAHLVNIVIVDDVLARSLLEEA